jgi:xylulose-5-phosphate/fructose-6-phosphate phosphoketolase
MFTGYGYQVRFVENMQCIDADLHASMEWAYNEIRAIQKAARTGNPIFKPRWPLLIMKTPKVTMATKSQVTVTGLDWHKRTSRRTN